MAVRTHESHWSQDMRLPLEMSTRSTRRSEEAAREAQGGNAIALPEQSPGGPACATQLWSYHGGLGTDACAARRSRSWEGSCTQNPISEEQLDPRAASPCNPQRASSRSLDGLYGNGMPPVSPWSSQDSGGRPSSRAAAYQSEAKRSAEDAMESMRQRQATKQLRRSLRDPAGPAVACNVSSEQLGRIIKRGASSSMARKPLADSRRSSEERTARTIRVMCKSDGRFEEGVDGIARYKGGETRLAQISTSGSMMSWKEALGRAFPVPASLSPEDMLLKCQLPGAPDDCLDILDDTDVKLILEEWIEHKADHGDSAGKLLFYVAWAPSVEQLSLSESRVPSSSLDESVGSPLSSLELQESIKGLDALRKKWLADGLNIIEPSQLVVSRHIGSSNFREEFVGAWNSSEVVVTCLKSSVFLSGAPEAASQVAVEEMLQEAAGLAALRHPNVVCFFGTVLPEQDALGAYQLDTGAIMDGHSVTYPAVISEIMCFGSLQKLLAKLVDKPLSAMQRLMIAVDAAKGMAFLHRRGVMHLALHSASLLMTYGEKRMVCKVANFGHSKERRDSFLSGLLTTIDTLPWLAPEVFAAPDSISEKVDVYSFGIIMWELWTRQRPYGGLDKQQYMQRTTSSGFLLRPDAEEFIPAGEQGGPAEPALGWCQLMRRCWHPNPAMRPTFEAVVGTLTEMVTALRAERRRSVEAEKIKKAFGVTSQQAACEASDHAPVPPGVVPTSQHEAMSDLLQQVLKL